MIIGVLTIEILIYYSSSLKEKRFVLKSIKDRLKNKYNVSVAELEYQDKWQRSLIGISMISNQKSFVEKEMQADARLYRDTKFREGLIATLEQRVADYRETG